MKNEIIKVCIDSYVKYQQEKVMREDKAYEYITSKLNLITVDLVKRTGHKDEYSQIDLTNLATINVLLGFKVANTRNPVYEYVRENWLTLESIGCTKNPKNGNYKLSFRGILNILQKFEYNFDRQTPIEEVMKEKQTENVVMNPVVMNQLEYLKTDDVSHITSLSFNSMVQEQRRILTDKYNELNDEYVYRGEQLQKLSQAIDSLNLLADIDNFVVW